MWPLSWAPDGGDELVFTSLGLARCCGSGRHQCGLVVEPAWREGSSQVALVQRAVCASHSTLPRRKELAKAATEHLQ